MTVNERMGQISARLGLTTKLTREVEDIAWLHARVELLEYKYSRMRGIALSMLDSYVEEVRDGNMFKRWMDKVEKLDKQEVLDGYEEQGKGQAGREGQGGRPTVT
jgi:hypothetical protein